MKKVIESTDRQHLGEVVDETSKHIVFYNGESMDVEKIIIRGDGTILLYSSNYQIAVEE